MAFVGTPRGTFQRTHRDHLSLAGVADPQPAVLAGGAEQAAVAVPADVVDEVRVVVHGDQGLPSAHVPDYNQIITAWKTPQGTALVWGRLCVCVCEAVCVGECLHVCL